MREKRGLKVMGKSTTRNIKDVHATEIIYMGIK